MTSDLTELTVVGDDDTGLIAGVTSLLFERGVNVEDLDQAVHDGVFRMTMRVDTTGMVCKPGTLREDLHALGDDLGVDVQVRFPSDQAATQIAVLVTKESHCLQRLLGAAADGEIDAEVSVVVGNHDDLHPIAEQYGVPFYDIGDDRGQPDEERLLDVLDDHDVDLVVLARYMRVLGPDVVFRYESRIVNVHPSLLPAFPGAKAYVQAVEAGVRVAGVTAHYVTTDLDQGPIIAQRAFDVPDDADADDLRASGQPLEAAVLLEAVKLHLNDDVSVHRGRTRVRGDADDYQLGLPPAVADANADRPVNGDVRTDAGSAADD